MQYRVDFDGVGGYIDSFGDFLGLSFTLRAAGMGNYTLNLSGFDERISLIQDDAIMRVWMTDPAFGIPWTNIFNGIHKTFVDTVAENGRLTWQSYGPGCEELLEKEIVAYPSGTSQANKTGAAASVMREYARENIGDLATVANGRDYDGVNPVVMAAGTAVGASWTGSRARRRLLDVMIGIRHDSYNQGDPVDFRVNYLGNYRFQFQAGKLGVDRTAGGLDGNGGSLGHARGEAPVILSPRYGNCRSITRSRSRYNEGNLAIALGQDVGVARNFQVVRDTAAAAVSPIAQRVVTTNATSEASAAGLLASAAAALDANVSRDKYTIVPFRGTAAALVGLFPGLDRRNFTSEVLWRDYFLFDFVTVEDYRTGQRQNVQIDEVSVTVGRSGGNVEDVVLRVREI